MTASMALIPKLSYTALHFVILAATFAAARACYSECYKLSHFDQSRKRDLTETGFRQLAE